ncbi:hypothetical protein DSC45_20870 [Streptomyces sp. YIM 130001]|uniref:hypothetical protein n=1 Tax=Streptomyces sp. YIM 130001 TaxID=2259644 RepID=UPI000E648B52|nr:hypothetical protein [Streptomyces sp. YIM 130001]RII14811.1 hypothetical protein DSC45_20870 [Streptomyces sp. YIM 130001]
MEVSARVERRIRHDFPDPGFADQLLRLLDALPRVAGYDPHMLASERVQAAVVLSARGSVRGFVQAVQLAREDWRDLLVAARLADRDWPDRLDSELGPPPGRRRWPWSRGPR